MRAAFYLVLFIVASPAWAYDPCNGLREANRMAGIRSGELQAKSNALKAKGDAKGAADWQGWAIESDGRLADYQRRLNECNEAVKKAEPQIRALNQGRMPR